MANHSSTLAWRIPWMQEPGGLQSMGSQRVGHDLVTSLFPASGSFPPEEGMANHSSILAARTPLSFKNTLCSSSVLWLCESLVLCNCIRADHNITWETLLSANVLPAPTLHSLSGLCLEGYLSIVPKKIYT